MVSPTNENTKISIAVWVRDVMKYPRASPTNTSMTSLLYDVNNSRDITALSRSLRRELKTQVEGGWVDDN
jgi:hypothetical protein